MSARGSDWRLVIGLLAGPLIALFAHGTTYMNDMWVCGSAAASLVRLLPPAWLVLALGAAGMSWVDWRRLRSAPPDNAMLRRAEFMAGSGVALSVFSSLIIAAQWAATSALPMCAR